MKCNNAFSFTNFHIQDGIVFAGRVGIAVLLCILWNILKAHAEDATGYIKLIQLIFSFWTVYSVYEYALSWIFPVVKTIEFEQDHIVINGKDKYTYTKDAFVSARVMRFTPIDLNRYLDVVDEEEGKHKIYWFGNVIYNKENSKRKEVCEKIVNFENKLFEKFAYAYLCDNASEDNTFVNIDVKRISQEHLINTIMFYAPASVLLFSACMTILTGPVSLFLFLLSLVLFAFGIMDTIGYRRDIMTFVNTAEITRKCIRLENDLFDINKGLDVTYLTKEKDSKELPFKARGTYLKIKDGTKEKRFWLGPDYLCRKEQVLLKYVLDSIVKYVKFYGDT